MIGQEMIRSSINIAVLPVRRINIKYICYISMLQIVLIIIIKKPGFGLCPKPGLARYWKNRVFRKKLGFGLPSIWFIQVYGSLLEPLHVLPHLIPGQAGLVANVKQGVVPGLFIIYLRLVGQNASHATVSE